ncbi:MAG: HAMP domain-containing histidine kinase [Planctomycetaceae bacterium]|nr:HAMP domain-containing histidine kinase [Planctomycetaceae bacterium]
MLSRWPIRNKLLAGLGLLLVIVATLSGSGFYGFYAYRETVRRLSSRANELPLTTELSQAVGDLKASLYRLAPEKNRPSSAGPPEGEQPLTEFSRGLAQVQKSLHSYRTQLEADELYAPRADGIWNERRTMAQIDVVLTKLARDVEGVSTPLAAEDFAQLDADVQQLRKLAAVLPGFFHEDLRTLRDDVRGQYRTLIVLAWVTSILALLLFVLFVKLFYDWVFRPLRILVKGSRRVAAGQFSYRIQLDTRDEMSELAEAMNDMTARFRAIRDDLDEQVRERTNQVIRSEQLASVGFLAAGVAHEINNPLASIAMCAESLESRLGSLLPADHADQDVVRSYLKMIQTEAFRCKEITEKLLDFSRLCDTQHQPAELRELVQGVIDMVGHIGKYHGKQVVLLPGPAVMAQVNPQEIKQVVLNLVTNGLDSLEPGGLVQIELAQRAGLAELVITDNGCGMTSDVLAQIFQPFFTRRRNGQGTGLGLSITYRIVADHGGHIEASSAGPGLGSRFCVTLPLAANPSRKESRHQYQAA